MYTMEYPASVTKENLELSSGVIVDLSRQYHYILAPICIFFLLPWHQGCLAGALNLQCVSYTARKCITVLLQVAGNRIISEGQRSDLNLYKSLSQGELIT